MFPEGRILDLLIVFAVALVVVGPKDLPVLMRKVGRFIAHMRGLAAEFRASFDEMARQSELDELRKEVEAMKAGRVHLPGLAPDEHTQSVFDDIHRTLRQGDAPAPMMTPLPPAPVEDAIPETAPAPAQIQAIP